MPLIDAKGNRVKKSGAIIRYLIPGGPGDKGGLKVNDVILVVGNKPIKGPSNVVNEINSHGKNKPLKFTINRSNKILELYITPIDIHELGMNK